MAYYPELDEEDELEIQDGPKPVDTIAGVQTPRHQVMQRIAEVRQGGSEKEATDDQDQRALEFAQANSMTAGLGRALNAFASGTGYKADNSAYDAMDKQGSNVLSQQLDRSAKIKQAIEARKGKEAALAAGDARFDKEFGLKEKQLDAKVRRDSVLERIANQGVDFRGRSLDQRLDEKEMALAVPGFERTGEVLPKSEEAVKFREAKSEADNLLKSLGRLKELVAEHGSFEYGGPAGQEMKSLVRDIQLQAKGPAMYQLGVLAGPDMAILEDITADTGSLSSLFTKDETRQSQIDSQIKSIQNRLGSKASSLGYRPIEQPKTDKVKMSQSSDSQMTKVIGGKTYKKVPGGWEEVE